MPSISSIITGLQILAKYEDKGLESHGIAAEHDVIFGPGPAPEASEFDDEPYECPITPDELATLESLDWFWDNEVQSWAHFC